MVLNSPWITQLKKEATIDDFEISSKAQNQFWADTLNQKSIIVTVWIQFPHWSGYQYFFGFGGCYFLYNSLNVHRILEQRTTKIIRNFNNIQTWGVPFLIENPILIVNLYHIWYSKGLLTLLILKKSTKYPENCE